MASRDKDGAGEKKRTWTFVLYPESAPPDWRERLKISGLMAAVSPIHDRDVNPTGEAKKPHHHVVVVYSGPTTYNAVAKLTASYNATIPQALESVRGMYRYFTHKDNPEKFQYDEHLIEHFNGFNLADLVELTKGEVNELKKQIMNFIRDLDIVEYADLIETLIDNEMFAEFEIAVNNTILFNTFIASRRHASEAKQRQREREEEMAGKANARKDVENCVEKEQDLQCET